MIRILIDIEENGDVFCCKEAVAMALEKFGTVRIVKITDGRAEK